MSEWVTVKEYAETHGVTIQAVYQQLKRKKNKPFIDAHSKVVKGTKYLDSEAVEYLENQRDNTPSVVVQEDNSDRLKELQNENELLKAKIFELYEENRAILKENAEQTKLIAQAEAQKVLLEDREKELAKFKPSFFGLYRKEE